MSSTFQQQTITEDGQLLLKKAQTDQVETVWDRHQAQQPKCGYCDMGLSCRICVMGPCRMDPFGEGPQQGVCGADADIIVARNLCRMIAAGAASHSDHGRDLVEVLAEVAKGHAPGYAIREAEKLKQRGRRIGWKPRAREVLAIAGELADAMQEDYGTRIKADHPPHAGSRQTPGDLGKAGDHSPGHRPGNFGDDAPHAHGRGQRLADPAASGAQQRPVRRLGRLHDRNARSRTSSLERPPQSPPASMSGVLKKDQVNIIVHGHNPVVSEMLLYGLPVFGLGEACQKQGRQRHQSGRSLLHGERTAHAARRPHGWQPPHDRAGAFDGRRGHDARGLPVHHAVPGKGGGLLPHADDQHERQGPLSRNAAPGISSGQRRRTGQEPGAGGHRKFRQTAKVYLPVEPVNRSAGFRWKPSSARLAEPWRHCSMPSRREKSEGLSGSWDATTPASCRTTGM